MELSGTQEMDFRELKKMQAGIKEFKRVILVYNRNSGTQFFSSMATKITEISGALKHLSGACNAELCIIDSFPQVDEIAEKAFRDKADWVIIAGGDGTIRAMIEKMSDRGYFPYISIFPAGTVNLVGKELDISSNTSYWLESVKTGNVVSVYTGRTNGSLFLTVTGIGFDSLVVENVSETEKKVFNKLAYAWEGMDMVRREMLLGNWRYRFKVRFDNEETWHEAVSVIVGKSRYYAGIYCLFKDASISEPILHAALFKGSGRSDFMRYAAAIAKGNLDDVGNIMIKKAREIEICCNEKNFPAELDGDAVEEAPLKIKLVEEPLKFIV